MEVTTIFQMIYLVGALLICMTVVYLPRIALTGNRSTELSTRSIRILDLTNFFAVGVFLATCFVMLMPHVELTFVASFSSLHLDAESCYKMVQLVVMLGFLFVYFLEKTLDYCKSSFSDISIDNTHHNLFGSKKVGPAPKYVVTFEKIEEDNNDEDELKRGDTAIIESVEECSLQTHKNSRAKINFMDEVEYEEEEEEEEEDDDESKHLVADHSTGHKKHSKIYKRCSATIEDLGKKTSNTQTPYPTKSKLAPNNLQNVSLHFGVGQFDVRCAAMLLALCVHSMFEGVTLGLQSQMWHFLGLAGAVAIHQIIAALAVGVSLTKRGLASLSFFISSLLFSAAIPLGVVIGIILSNFSEATILEDQEVGISSMTPKIIAACLQALTVGTFIYVIFVEILPSEMNRQQDQVFKMILLIIGFTLVTCLAFFLAKS